MSEKSDEEIFQDLFPEEWICPFCMSDDEKIFKVPNQYILMHVKSRHSEHVDKKTTWKAFYLRMAAVGGL